RASEQVAAEEREDLEPLALQGVGNRAVVEQRDAHVALEAGERGLQPVGERLRVADERLHLGLAEVAATGALEAAAEALAAGDADGEARDLVARRAALEHRDAGALELRGDARRM